MTIFLVIVITFVIEVILWITWNPLYFRHGILVFRRTYRVTLPEFHFPSADELDSNFDEDTKAPSLVFAKIGDGMIGTRETLKGHWGNSLYTPIIRASIQHDRYTGELTLRCFLSLTVSVALIGYGLFALPGFLKDIDTYGSILVHMAFLAFIGFLIVSALTVVSVYSISRFKRVLVYLLEHREKAS